MIEIEERDFIDLIQCYFRVRNKHQDPEIEATKTVYGIANKYGHPIKS